MSRNKSLLVCLIETIDEYRIEQRGAAQKQTAQLQRPSRLHRFLHWMVPNGGTLLLVAILIVTAQVWAEPLTGPSNAPDPSATTINYQGRLADSGGTPLDGTYGMSFSLWDADTGGSLVWGPENHLAVPVNEGLFSVGLGSQTTGGIPTNVWDSGRYLEISVGGETLAPRELIRSVPIAGMALTVPDGAIGASQIADGAIDSRNTQLSTGRIQASISGGVMELTDDYQDVPGTTLTLTPETNQTYLVYVVADFDALNALATARLEIDGTFQWGTVLFKSHAGDRRERATVSQVYLVNLDGGTHTLVLRAKRNTGTSARIYGVHTTITYLAVSQ